MLDTERKMMIAQRLRQLRKEAGLTRDGLSKAIEKKSGFSISKQMFDQYEVLNQENAKWDSVSGMSLEKLYYIADFYGVSTEYVLGLTDIRTKDTELAAVCEYTGLNEEAVRYLHECAKSKNRVIAYLVNKMLPKCEDLFYLMHERIELEEEMAYIEKMYPHADFEDIVKNWENINESMLPEEEVTAYNAAVEAISRHFSIQTEEMPIARFRAFDFFNQCLDEIAFETAARLDVHEYRKRVEDAKLEEIELDMGKIATVLNQLNGGSYTSIHQEARLKKAEY